MRPQWKRKFWINPPKFENKDRDHSRNDVLLSEFTRKSSCICSYSSFYYASLAFSSKVIKLLLFSNRISSYISHLHFILIHSVLCFRLFLCSAGSILIPMIWCHREVQTTAAERASCPPVPGRPLLLPPTMMDHLRRSERVGSSSSLPPLVIVRWSSRSFLIILFVFLSDLIFLLRWNYASF